MRALALVLTSAPFAAEIRLFLGSVLNCGIGYYADDQRIYKCSSNTGTPASSDCTSCVSNPCFDVSANSPRNT